MISAVFMLLFFTVAVSVIGGMSSERGPCK